MPHYLAREDREGPPLRFLDPPALWRSFLLGRRFSDRAGLDAASVAGGTVGLGLALLLLPRKEVVQPRKLRALASRILSPLDLGIGAGQAVANFGAERPQTTSVLELLDGL